MQKYFDVLCDYYWGGKKQTKWKFDEKRFKCKQKWGAKQCCHEKLKSEHGKYYFLVRAWIIGTTPAGTTWPAQKIPGPDKLPQKPSFGWNFNNIGFCFEFCNSANPTQLSMQTCCSYCTKEAKKVCKKAPARIKGACDILQKKLTEGCYTRADNKPARRPGRRPGKRGRKVKTPRAPKIDPPCP